MLPFWSSRSSNCLRASTCASTRCHQQRFRGMRRFPARPNAASAESSVRGAHTSCLTAAAEGMPYHTEPAARQGFHAHDQ